ncbi:putative DNA replication factor C subunit Rfc5 [Gregarina niphandrodes]|uniref:DNA replication factor C subunit Rfc5 n=1 Tax=Gregarina niphandrodes TaxID=110365 RepID=A0A023B0B0_GRENI|nr:putative DNA replication factor C subunit Rfc5 [Gregarina niphandrodes]EZG45090.1 putative DNA replication factor C subunit Rfc5 [Gregarina niphandrodes]|eukprot:XP_011132553.1 putative DNA replication factor C subunit Rfc5 [Gregarina niphandrodes]
MMMWVDEFAPKSLAELDFHKPVTEMLERIASLKDVPHLLFHGPSGAGKCTRARLLLKALYGDGAALTKKETVQVDSKLEFNVYGSIYHTEIYCSDLGFKDRQCVQTLIKGLAGLGSSAGFGSGKPKCRVFMLHEAHTLTLAAQASLRRTMERYSSTSRFFLLTERLSSLIAPLRSRCICIRVPAPDASMVEMALRKTPAAKKTVTALAATERNMRRAFVRAQLINIRGTNGGKLDWEHSVDQIVLSLRKPSIEAFLNCRNQLQEAYAHGIDGQLLLETLADRLILEVAENNRPLLAKAAAFYSQTMAQGSKEVFHLEGFIAHCLCLK